MTESVIIAAITGIVGVLVAILPRLVDLANQRNQARVDALKAQITDAGERAGRADERAAKAEAAIDGWREKYYGLREHYIGLQTRYSAIVLILRANSLEHLVANLNQPIELDDDERAVNT